MKRRALLGLFLMVMSAIPLPASALLEAGPTTIPDVSPLIITSYLTKNNGTDLVFLELYNSGTTPLKLSEWAITDVTNGRTLNVAPPTKEGLFEPKTHITIATHDTVSNATYQIAGWSTLVAAPKAIGTLQLTHTGYRPLDVTIAVKSIDIWMMRSYLTTGYSSVTFETNYRQLYDDGLYLAPLLPAGLRVVEIYPYASDCTPFDKSPLCGDYVKLQNTSQATVGLDGFVLRTDSNSANRTMSNTVTLTGELQPGQIQTVTNTDDGGRFSLTNSGGYVWLEDTWGLVRYDDTLTKYEAAGSAEQGYAYALDMLNQSWQWTTTPMPGKENQLTPRPIAVPTTVVCPEGKYLNPDTNRCRSVADAINTLATCDEGSERNPLTNRCRKVTVASTGVGLAPCGEGQERSPTTNRCRSIASAVAELLPCDEGYERNPTTNRCRKIKTTDMPVASYPVKTSPRSPQTTATWWAVGGVGAIALAYAGWEWRAEVSRIFRRLVTLVHK